MIDIWEYYNFKDQTVAISLDKGKTWEVKKPKIFPIALFNPTQETDWVLYKKKMTEEEWKYRQKGI